MTYTKQDCTDALQKATERLGHSPTHQEYDELDLSPSSRTIKRRFGSWNNAKEVAELETFDRKRGHSVNENYFDDLDSVEKVYWLGFLYGDGTVYENQSGTTKIQLQLARVDKNHVEKFRDAIGSGHKVNEYSQNGNEKVGLTITSDELGESLANHGFMPGKTTSNKLPVLKTTVLFRGFVRGLSDADGHCALRQWTITGSNRVRLKRLSHRLPFDTYVYDRERDEGGRYVLTLNGVNEVASFYGWLYPNREDTAPALERKREDALNHASRNR